MRDAGNIKKLILFIVVCIPLIIAPKTLDYFYYPKILAVYICVLLMIGIQITAPNRTKLEFDLESKLLLLYIVLICIATLFSINIINSIWGSFRREEGLIALITYCFLFFFSKGYCKISKRQADWIIRVAVVISIYGIFQYFGYDPIPRDELRLYWVGLPFSTMGNPNFLGTYLVLILPIAIFSYVEDNNYGKLFASSILYTTILLTFTRSAWVGIGVIFVGIILYVYKNKETRKRFIILIVIFVCITAFINAQTGGRLNKRFVSIGNESKILTQKENGYESAGSGRIYIWTRTIEFIKARPVVGYGAENLGIIFNEKYRDEMTDKIGQIYIFDKAHNEYLHIAVSSGVPALLVYLAFVFLCLRRGFYLIKNNSKYIPYHIAILAYLAQAFFNVSVVSVAYIFWIYLGLICNDKVFESV